MSLIGVGLRRSSRLRRLGVPPVESRVLPVPVPRVCERKAFQGGSPALNPPPLRAGACGAFSVSRRLYGTGLVWKEQAIHLRIGKWMRGLRPSRLQRRGIRTRPTWPAHIVSPRSAVAVEPALRAAKFRFLGRSGEEDRFVVSPGRSREGGVRTPSARPRVVRAPRPEAGQRGCLVVGRSRAHVRKPDPTRRNPSRRPGGA